jgi:Flp pilus assembly protein TadD
LGNWSEAVAFFRRAANQNGSDFRAFNMLGYSLRHTGDLAGALKAYNRALTMKPDYAQALEYRGMAHIKMRNKKAALVDYNKLVRLGSPLAADLKEAIDKTAKN